jgi:homopolymeric O-antigen transport system permease protein
MSLAGTAAAAAADRRPVVVRRAGTRAWRPLGNIRQLADYADLFLTITEHRIRVRYKQSVLGLAWAIVQPVSMMLIFTLVFGRITHVPTDGVPYALFAFTGLVLWSFVSTSLSNATHALVSHAQLITKVYFPREILPLSYVTAALFDLAVGTTVLLALLWWYQRPVGFHLLLALPIVVITALLVTALALLLSALQVRFRDVGLAVPLLLYLWMFSTPIAYPLSSIPARYRLFFELNPLTGLIEAFRQVVLAHGSPSPSLLAVPIVFAAVLLPIAYGVFKHAEVTMADVI